MNFLCTILLFFTVCSVYATTYTFHTSGDYTNEANWDAYPGETIDVGDTIVIDAFSIDNIQLLMWGGHLLFTDNAVDVSIWDLEVNNSATIEIQGSYIDIHINSTLAYYSFEEIISDCYLFLEIHNNGSGFYGIDFALNDLCGQITYYNNGQEEASILGMNDINVFNWGTLNTFPGDLYVTCNLHMENGTITGYEPYQLIQLDGEINQNCSSCTAYILNASAVIIKNGEITGTIIIDDDD